MTFSIDGRPPLNAAEKPMARDEDVSLNFFKTMGMRILEGRGFTDEDAQGGVKAIIIDENLARRFFPPKESELLAALSGQERKRVFFTYWTCKEAYLKAIGMGLFFPLGQVEVTLDEKHQPVSVGVHGESHEDERWSCQQVCPAVDYVSALVTEGKDVQLRCWQYGKCKGVSLSHAIGRIQKK